MFKNGGSELLEFAYAPNIYFPIHCSVIKLRHLNYVNKTTSNFFPIFKPPPPFSKILVAPLICKKISEKLAMTSSNYVIKLTLLKLISKMPSSR